MVGQKFGRLTVVKARPELTKRWRRFFECRCECGTIRIVDGSQLRTGHTKSCGCYRDDMMSARQIRHGDATTRHGETTEHRIWRAMKDRCYREKCAAYPDYGGRGIAVCAEWHDYAAFLRDMGRRPSAKHSIDRIDNNGDYTPQNCRWATCGEQTRNRRNNVMLTFEGTTLCMTDWAIKLGVPVNLIKHRLRRHWSTERTLMVPSRSLSPASH